jgi:hypothetical protein
MESAIDFQQLANAIGDAIVNGRSPADDNCRLAYGL